MSSEKSKSLFAAKFTASLVPSNNKDAVPNCFAAVSNCALPSKLTVCAEGLASVVVVAPSVPSKFKSNFVTNIYGCWYIFHEKFDVDNFY